MKKECKRKEKGKRMLDAEVMWVKGYRWVRWGWKGMRKWRKEEYKKRIIVRKEKPKEGEKDLKEKDLKENDSKGKI